MGSWLYLMRARSNFVGIIVVLLLIVGSLMACGGGDAGSAAPTQVTEPIPAPTPLPATPNRNTDLGDPMGEDPFIIGVRIFLQEAAEGVGCSYCHALDGRGDIGPNIRGKTPGQIQMALDTFYSPD